MRLSPSLDMRGIFKVRKPFELPIDSIHSVGSVRGIPSMETGGIDVYSTVYAPANLSRSEYQADLVNTPKIIELISDGGRVTLVPDTYLVQLPESNAPVYHRTLVSVDLGLLPEGMDVRHIAKEMGDIASGLLGVNADTKVHHLPYRGEVTKSMHLELEDKRRQNRDVDARTTYLKNIELNKKVELLSQHVAMLHERLGTGYNN